MIVIKSDASVKKSGAGISWIIEQYPEDRVLMEDHDFLPGDYTSVEGEYEAILRAVRYAVGLGKGMYLLIESDCEPIVEHLKGTAPMRGRGDYYKRKVFSVLGWFEDYRFTHISREQNEKTDAKAFYATMNHGN